MNRKILIISAVFPPEPVVSSKLSFDIATSLSKNNFVTVISPFPSRPLGFHFNKESPNKDFKHIQIDSYICAKFSILGRFKESYSFGKCCQNYIMVNHEKIDVVSTKEGRKDTVNKLREEIIRATKKERYLSREDAKLIKLFLNKIQMELQETE